MNLVGILLAAGRGARFDASAQRLKLLEAYPVGRAEAPPLVLMAARKLRVLGPVIAVVRASTDAHQQRLHALLAAEGCQVLSYTTPDRGANASTQGALGDRERPEGTGTSIACAVRASAGADGWIIALADMPAIAPSSYEAVRQALCAGRITAAPYYQGQRGHPVGFGAACGAELAALAGDEGARAVLERYRPFRVEVDDPGVLFDVDQPEDLRAGAPGAERSES
jgi:molybdenum cofactor cytidylyltransferase